MGRTGKNLTLKLTLRDGFDIKIPSADFGLYTRHISTFNFHGSDNNVTVEAVRRLGYNFRGIGLLRDGVGEMAVKQFADWRMAGVRLNYVHGGVLSWEGA